MEKVAARIIQNVRFVSGPLPTPCWVWQLSTISGYGSINVSGGRLVHRVSYLIFRGPIPAGLQLDHLCRNRGCANPFHLELVTAAENVRRGKNAKLSAQEIAEIRASTEIQVALAARFGVTQGYISKVKRGYRWAPDGVKSVR